MRISLAGHVPIEIVVEVQRAAPRFISPVGDALIQFRFSSETSKNLNPAQRLALPSCGRSLHQRNDTPTRLPLQNNGICPGCHWLDCDNAAVFEELASAGFGLEIVIWSNSSVVVEMLGQNRLLRPHVIGIRPVSAWAQAQLALPRCAVLTQTPRTSGNANLELQTRCRVYRQSG